MRGLAYKIGLRLERIAFIRSAIEDNADLSAFDHKPTFKLIFGLFLIITSNAICWPTIAALTAMSIYYKKPWLLVIGGPLVYGITFFACSAGMVLSGGKYARAFFRWLLRVLVERMLSRGDSHNSV